MTGAPLPLARRSLVRRIAALLAGLAPVAVLRPAAATREAPPGAAPSKRIPLIETHVAGTAYHRAAEVRTRLGVGQRLELRREPENEYDERAIEVRTIDGIKLGYVPRTRNEALASLMDSGKMLAAEITTIDPERRDRYVDIEIRVSMLE